MTPQKEQDTIKEEENILTDDDMDFVSYHDPHVALLKNLVGYNFASIYIYLYYNMVVKKLGRVKKMDVSTEMNIKYSTVYRILRELEIMGMLKTMNIKKSSCVVFGRESKKWLNKDYILAAKETRGLCNEVKE